MASTMLEEELPPWISDALLPNEKVEWWKPNTNKERITEWKIIAFISLFSTFLLFCLSTWLFSVQISSALWLDIPIHKTTSGSLLLLLLLWNLYFFFHIIKVGHTSLFFISNYRIAEVHYSALLHELSIQSLPLHEVSTIETEIDIPKTFPPPIIVDEPPGKILIFKAEGLESSKILAFTIPNVTLSSQLAISLDEKLDLIKQNPRWRNDCSILLSARPTLPTYPLSSTNQHALKQHLQKSRNGGAREAVLWSREFSRFQTVGATFPLLIVLELLILALLLYYSGQSLPFYGSSTSASDSEDGSSSYDDDSSSSVDSSSSFDDSILGRLRPFYIALVCFFIMDIWYLDYFELFGRKAMVVTTRHVISIQTGSLNLKVRSLKVNKFYPEVFRLYRKNEGTMYRELGQKKFHFDVHDAKEVNLLLWKLHFGFQYWSEV